MHHEEKRRRCGCIVGVGYVRDELSGLSAARYVDSRRCASESSLTEQGQDQGKKNERESFFHIQPIPSQSNRLAVRN